MDADLLSRRVIPFRRPVTSSQPDWPAARVTVPQRAARPAPLGRPAACEGAPASALATFATACGNAVTIALLLLAAAANAGMLLSAFGVRLGL